MNFVKPDGSDITGNNMLLRKYLCSGDIHSEIYVSENVQDSRTDFENVDRKQEENYNPNLAPCQSFNPLFSLR